MPHFPLKQISVQQLILGGLIMLGSITNVLKESLEKLISCDITNEDLEGIEDKLQASVLFQHNKRHCMYILSSLLDILRYEDELCKKVYRKD